MLRMYRHEQRELRVTIKSSDKVPFSIREAKYQVWWHDGHEMEYEGTCTINDNKLTAVISAEHTGLYVVKFIMGIAGETVIRKVYIRVSAI